MIRRALYFLGPHRVEVREEEMSEPGSGQVVVESLVSAISAGSELMVYTGAVHDTMAVDRTIPALAGHHFTFPLKYGYSAAGRVTQLGSDVQESWQGRHVFSFQPHQSHFIANTSDLFPLPEGFTPDQAVFLPNLETAVNLVMDGRPLIGETVVVFGQGMVGLLTTALLSRFPLERLLTLDPYPRRREQSRKLGAHESLDPTSPKTPSHLTDSLATSEGADLVYELTGNPGALNMAIDACGFSSRIVVGSWYGRNEAGIDLGGKFHRERIELVSSQVSSLTPELTGRWSKARRFELVWGWLREIDPVHLITRRFPLERAGEAYRLLHEDPSQDLQVVFIYLNAA
ncbi:MAG: oxidoreductase [Proteobacteria bacterium]|nr:oxidoreductase [Pseudomonadota bacterium]